MEIRIRETGQIVTEKQFRAMHPNTSFPRVLTESILASIGADIVFEGPQASGLDWWQHSARDGVQEINGKWYTRFVPSPVFATQEDEDVYIAEQTRIRNAAIYASIQESVQKRLDDFARTRNYDGILSACTYATSTVPKFASEGQYCVEARDATWSSCYQILADVQGDQRPTPSGYAEIESELPALQWPE